MLGILILGIVQGIAEFLPISSSAHLIIFRDLFRIGTNMSGNVGLVFDVALHVGTLLAICVFFFKDFLNMVIKGFTEPKKEGKTLWLIVISTIPAAIFGVLFEDVIENKIRGNFYIIAIALAVMGILIYLADKLNNQEKDVSKMTIKDALAIGCAQVLALIPGFSRSGTTIAAARCMKLDRESAAKYSFYLSAPVVLGASLLTLIKDNNITLIMNNALIFTMGILTSFIVGMLCITFLMSYLKKHDFKVFMWYRIILAMIVIIIALLR